MRRRRADSASCSRLACSSASSSADLSRSCGLARRSYAISRTKASYVSPLSGSAAGVSVGCSGRWNRSDRISPSSSSSSIRSSSSASLAFWRSYLASLDLAITSFMTSCLLRGASSNPAKCSSFVTCASIWPVELAHILVAVELSNLQ